MFKRKDYKEKQLRYSIRKVSFGAASVAIASLYLFMGSSAVSASEVQPVNGEQNTVTNTEEVKKNEKQTEETDIKKGETLDKTSLTKLIEEIDGKFTNGKYTSKTEDSVNQLKAALEAAKTALSTAQTQAELTQAHANLIVATTKLQTKALDKKEAPVVDTTNGKATVGKKATNTEKASESNSIANSGSRDERNGKEMDKNNPFRTDAATTDTDPAAHQTYTAPAENADLNELKSELLKLPDAVQNNTKIQDMNDLGDQTGVARGEVKEIQEFGGWKAINQPDGTPGKFAIARKTESGVFPVETVNTVYTNQSGNYYYDTYVGEQAFDRSKDYMLFLGKVRTIASETEQTFNGQPYKRTGLGGSDSYAIKSFSGIEKTFKAHSPETGSKVKVAFKTGFTGDLNGTKAKYLVEVVYRQNGSEVTAYTYTFAPQPRATVKNDKGIVTPAKDGTGRAYIRSNFNNYTLNKAEVEAKMAEDAYKPNGQAGTFTSSDIDLPAGVTEYTVRIKVTDTERMGMGYQSPLRHYALPVTGLDFSVEQDTRKLAKNLLQRVYDKLKATEAQDIKGKTDETISAYKEQLKNVENLLAGELNPTQTYKDIVTAVLAGQQALRTDKSKLDTSNTKLLDLINETPDPRIGKTPNSITPYDSAKEEAKKAQADAQSILNQENPDPDIVAAAVSKLNEKLAELKAARAELVVAATEDQKTKLKNDSDALKPADTNGKTPKSIEAYNARYKQLEEALNKVKEEAKKVLDKEVNAGKVEATDAQIEVDKIKAELDKAAALLKDKGNTDELENAKNELKTAAEVPNVTDGKTKGTSDKYDAAKTAAEQAVTAAEAVISDINSTTEDVANALAEVKAKKAALEAAKAALVDKVTPEQKTALGNAETDLAVLGDADLAGKTEESKEAYKAEVAKLNAEIEAAKQAAAAIVADADNKTQAEAALAQAKVETLKAKLEAAKAKLVDKADKAALTAAKEALDGQTKEEDPTSGKTTATAEAYKAAKTAAEEAVREAEAIIAKDNATPKEVADALAKVNEKKAALEAAKAALVDKITQDQKDDLTNAEENLKLADTTGKTKDSIKAYNDEVAKLSDELEAAKQAAKDLVDKGDNAGELEAYRVQAKINKLKSKLAEAAKLLKDIDKSVAKKEVEDAAKKATDVIVANNDLTSEQKAAAKAKVAEEATKAIDAIDKAKSEDDIKAATDAGKLAIEKEAAKAEIEAAKAAKEKAIEANDKLSDAEKQAAKEEAAKAADEAKKAIDAATDNAGVAGAKTTGTAAVEAVNPVGKDKAKAEIEKELAEKTKVIDTNADLTPDQKAEAKAKIAEEAKKAIDAIDKATTTEEVASAKESGKLAIEKEAAKAEIEAAKAAKEKAIDARTDLTDEEKATAKARVEEEAEAAKNAIDKATDLSDLDKVTETGKDDIKRVTVTSAKEEAKKAIDEALAAKEKAIDARTDLTDEEKAAAKKAAREEAEAAKKAIDKATTLEDINKVLEDEKANIAKINPAGAKEEAKKAIDEALVAKEKAIDARTDLTQEEKEAAKKAAREEAEAAKKAIDKATTSEDINKVLEDGKENIAKINPESLKDKAKKAIDEALAAKEKAIDARTDLTQEEKEAAKKAAREEAEAAKKAIDKATTSEDINKVLEDGKENIAKINPVGTKEDSKKSIEERLADKENRQPNNIPVKPQEDAKPAEVPSDNSEQPAVNQTEDVKGNSSTTSQESKASNQKVLPNTGTGNEISIFGSAAMTVLASLGLVATSKKKEEE